MCIGILTGGGVRSLNPFVEALVARATNETHKDVRPCRGWAARLDFDRVAHQ